MSLLRRWAPAAGLLALSAATSWLCWELRGFRMEGGDTSLFLSEAFLPFLEGECATFFFREPLAFALPQIVVRTVGAHWPKEDVYGLSSCLAGGLFAVVLALASRRPLFWLIMLVNATGFLFLGHIENYAFAYVCAVAVTLLGWRTARTRGALWPVVALWALGVGFHQAVAFMAPGVLALLVERRDGRLRWRGPDRSDTVRCLLLVIALGLLFVVPTVVSAFHLIKLVTYGTTGRMIEFITPLSEAMDDQAEFGSQMGAWMRYTMFSAAHLRDVAMFQLWLCPLGLAALGILAVQRRDAGDAFLLLAGGSMFLWSSVWHPHMGWNDWDLWSLMAAPLNTAAALVFSGERPVTGSASATRP